MESGRSTTANADVKRSFAASAREIFDGDRELLTTQVYIKDEPNNARDGLFNRMSNVEADAVSMEFVQGETGTEATINVVV